MNWYSTAFKFMVDRDMAYNDMESVGIRCDRFITGDGYYYLGWCPFSKEQYQTAVHIVTSHID